MSGPVILNSFCDNFQGVLEQKKDMSQLDQDHRVVVGGQEGAPPTPSQYDSLMLILMEIKDDQRNMGGRLTKIEANQLKMEERLTNMEKTIAGINTSDKNRTGNLILCHRIMFIFYCNDSTQLADLYFDWLLSVLRFCISPCMDSIPLIQLKRCKLV